MNRPLLSLCACLLWLGACDPESDEKPPVGDSGATTTPAGADADGDGYIAEAEGGNDCDDADPAVHPGATEVWYDGVDQDCDGTSDYDADADGHDAADHGGDDCDDTDATTYPGADEVWDDGIDQDCDGTVDRASSACEATFVFNSPLGEATIDGCQEWSLRAAFEFDPDDVPEVRSFQLSFDGSTEAEFECSVSMVQDHVCGTAYYRQGDTESGRTEVVTLDCSGVLDEDETTFSGTGYLYLTEIDTGTATGSFAGEPLYTGLSGTLAVSSGEYTLRGDFAVGAVQLAGDGEEQLDCAGTDGDLDDDGSLDVFYDGDDCDDSDPFTGPGFAANDSSTDCMRDADEDDWGDDTVEADEDGLVAGTDCVDDDPTVHPTAATLESGLCTRDADADGYGDAGAVLPIEAGTDCNDADAATFPGAASEATAGECMLDADGDGYGDMTASGLYDAGTDCNDADALEYPGAVTEATSGECMTDADGDGFGDAGAEGLYDAGTDCNDADASEFPGAVTEATAGECMTDADGDGFGDAGAEGLYDAGTDCNDADASEFPGAVTEATAGECMTDGDGDGFGDAGAEGLYDAGTDCNDADASEFPGAVTEATASECMTDADGDGYGDLLASGLYDTGTDCDDSSADTYPGAASLEPSLCTHDRDADGYGAQSVSSPVQAGTDCDDNAATTYPGVASLESYGSWYCMADADGDGYGDHDVAWPIYDGTDCDDASAATYPGAAALESTLCTLDADGDGYGDDSLAEPIDAGSDCDDADASIHPDVTGYDWLDGIDVNCDGSDNYNDLSSGSISHTAIRATTAFNDAGAHLAFGDVNGDGHLDMHVDSWTQCSYGGWVVNGPLSAWPADFDSADTTYVATTLDYGCRGAKSGAIGDVNDDGNDDLVVVDWGASTEVNAGYMFAGPLSATVDATVADLTITKGDPVACAPNGYGFGADYDEDAVLIDDLDGDGDDDVVFTSPLWWEPCVVGHHYNGAVFVFEGPLSAGLDVEDADLTLLGSESDSYFGTTARILTDVNGDGTNDLAVDSARPSGTLIVFYDPLSHADGLAEDEADYTVSATAGISAALGDHNGDGYGDIVALDGSYSAYELNIYDGSSAGLGTTPVATVTIDVLQADAFAGNGDFNADGYDDLLAGASLLTGPLSGALDAPTDALAVFDVDNLVLSESTVALEDLNSDGYDDVVIGARADSVLATSSGGVYVVPGQ